MIDTDEIYSNYANRFLTIGNATQAALDVGVPKDTVNEFLRIAKDHPDVMDIIAADEQDMPDFNNPESVKRFILKQLLRESQFKGQGAQQAARIAALKAIGELTGIEPPKKIDINQAAQGGMMVIPVMDATMWEQSAELMQSELKKNARE